MARFIIYNGAMPEAPPGSKTILVVVEDADLRDRATSILARSGYQPIPVQRGEEAWPILEARHHDAVLLDLEIASMDASDVLRHVRRMSPATPVLVLADPARLQAAVQALRHGAEDYLLRPPDPFELRTRLGRILERHDLDSRIALLQGELSKNQGLKSVVSSSPAMQAVLDRVLRIAPLKATVLIHGESGVGKELVARSIHFNSPRRDYPFIPLNCAAMPQSLIESELFGHEKGSFTGAHARARGKFEIAHRGTLFLDEIGEMDHATQAKLLRVLEEKEFMRVGGDQSIRVDVRVIAATNADLENMVERSLFRRDLYYRLKVLIVHVPPLRDRRQDIPALVETFLDELSRANAVPRKAIVPEALDALRVYHWPGNVRELKNILESVLVSSPGDVIRLEDLPPSVRRESVALERPEMAVGMTLEDIEREMIRRTLEHTGGNRTHCAALLGIGVRTLQRKIRGYRLEIPSKRRRPRRRPAAEKGR
jgi:DNA-binding NtrC family response regulator